MYGGPCIYIDFGTATSFGAVNERGFWAAALIDKHKVASEALVKTQLSCLIMN